MAARVWPFGRGCTMIHVLGALHVPCIYFQYNQSDDLKDSEFLFSKRKDSECLTGVIINY